MANSLTFEEIKAKYPNEWVLLGNPIIENTKVLAGIPIFHAKDKRDIAAQKINWRANFEGATTIFTGEFPKKRRFWL
jgi:hypothetical protein